METPPNSKPFRDEIVRLRAALAAAERRALNHEVRAEQWRLRTLAAERWAAEEAERERDACREIFKAETRCIDYDRWIGAIYERDSLKARLARIDDLLDVTGRDDDSPVMTEEAVEELLTELKLVRQSRDEAQMRAARLEAALREIADGPCRRNWYTAGRSLYCADIASVRRADWCPSCAARAALAEVARG